MVKESKLPPGQRKVDELLVLQYNGVPQIDPKKWELEIRGRVRNPLKIGYDTFLSLPWTIVKGDFHCVTGWTKVDTTWKGVLFRTILEICKPEEDARFVSIYCEDGYTTNLPIEVAADEDVVLAYEYQGRPLTPDHGFPVRLFVPKRYAYKSAKWVRGMELLTQDKKGYWETRGYSNSADPWKEERYG